jgi:hypothetical protein
VTDLTALLRRILDDRDLAACGVLADYLEERGDARGPALRERWREWDRERDHKSPKRHPSIYASWLVYWDNRLLAHVLLKFNAEWTAELWRRIGEAVRA